MMKRIVVAGLVLLGLRSAALANTLTTTPFPAFDVGVGNAVCIATNIGTTTGTASFEMIDSNGTVLDSLTNVSVNAGASVQGNLVNLVLNYPTYCTFTFNGKFKGSFAYTTPSATPIVVIPATK